MKTKRHWEYKDTRFSVMRFLEELLYAHRLHSLIEYAADETCDALGDIEAFDKFYGIEGDVRLYSSTLHSIGDMLLGLFTDYLPSRRISIREKASKIAYEVYNNMNFVQRRKSGALRRLAKMYEEENKKKEERKPVKRALVDPSAVSIHPPKQIKQ